MLTTGSPEFKRRISGSAPRLPTRMTLLTLPAMILLRAHPKQIFEAAPYSLKAIHVRYSWLFPQGFCSVFVLGCRRCAVNGCQQYVVSLPGTFDIGADRDQGENPLKPVAHEDHQREQWRAGVETRMHVSARNGTTQLCIFEQWVEPTVGAPTHWHPVEEVLTVVAGKAEMWIDDERTVLTSGQSLVIPAHRKHGFRNVGIEELHVYAVLASPFFEATFDGLAQPMRRWAS
ncbi:cupin domain-containing protein [Mesorhizobium sp. BHbdii]